MTTGKALCKKLESSGYKLLFLDKEGLSKYVTHLGRATLIMNPDIFTVCHNYVSRWSRNRLSRALKATAFNDILSDKSLDR